MAIHYFVQCLFAITGILIIAASVGNWNWFFTAYNSQWLVKSVGRKRARQYYAIIGVILIGLAIYLFTHTPHSL